MSYTNLQLLRKMIADPYKSGFDEVVADGESQDFQLSHHPVKTSSYQVLLDGNLQTESTDYTLDLETGLLNMVALPTAELELDVKYEYSVFSDTELTEFLELDGTVDKAAVRCIDILLADSARRFDYSAGLTDMKPSQIFEHLKDLKAMYSAKTSVNAGVTTRGSKYYAGNTDKEVDLSRADL